MKPIIAIIVLLVFAFLTPFANALTNEEISGTYLGTSVASLPDGTTATATVNIKFQPKGVVRTISSVNGVQSTTRGRYRFLTDNIIAGTFPNGDFVAFAGLNGDTLTFNVLVQRRDGIAILEKTVAKRAR